MIVNIVKKNAIMEKVRLIFPIGMLAVLLMWLCGCKNTEVSQDGKTERRSGPPPATKAKSKSDQESDKAAFEARTHQEAINTILSLARGNEWEKAETQASALYATDPKNPYVQRIYSWVKTEGPKRREKALEDEIRDVTTQNSRTSPSFMGIFKDRKSQGLPPRSDLREALDQLKATPYIPDNFGKTVESRGTLDDFESNKGRMTSILEKEVSVQLDSVTLESIIFNIGQAEGINFIADKALPAFQQKISVNMKNVKLSEFLRYVSRNMDLQFQVGSDLIWIVDGKDPKKMLEETRFYRLHRGFVLPAQFGQTDAVRTSVTANNVTTVSEVAKFDNFVNDGASRSPSIELAIKSFFEGSKSYIDYERNIIVARGTHEQLRVMDRIVEEFDRPVQQVLIEARFITVTEASFLQLGANWETGRDPLTLTRTATDYTGLGNNVGLGLQETWTGVLGRQTLSATLTAIEQSGESEVLSAPRLTLVNNLPARISDGKEQNYYEQYTVSQTILDRRSTSNLAPQGKPTKFNSGVTLEVLASIGGDGRSIMLALSPKVVTEASLVTFATINDRDDTGKVTSSFDIKLPESRTQSLSTRVVVKSGQTVVMGGVMEHEQRKYVESVPVLSNIPLLGAAFRKKVEYDRPRYLLVFVTATLLSESGEFVTSPESE
jgi:type IV pilus assembly protein PilQ